MRSLLVAATPRCALCALSLLNEHKQDIENVGKAAGLGGEAIEKMVDKFIKGLPAGSDLEPGFYA